MIKLGIIGAGLLGKKIHQNLLVAQIEAALYDKTPVSYEYGVSLLDYDDDDWLRHIVHRKDVIISTIQNCKIEAECRHQNKIYVDGLAHPNITAKEIIHLLRPFTG